MACADTDLLAVAYQHFAADGPPASAASSDFEGRRGNADIGVDYEDLTFLWVSCNRDQLDGGIHIHSCRIQTSG